MRKLLALAAVLAVATPAFAGLNVDARFDYFSGTSNNTSSTTNTSISGFLWDWLRVTGDGKVVDGTTFMFRLNPMAVSNSALSGGTGTTGAGAGTIPDSTNGNDAAKLAGVNPAKTGLLLGGLPSTGVSDLVDYAEVATKVADNVTVHAGKLANNYMSGFEAKTAPADMYFASQGNLYTAYLTGLAGEYKLADNQQVALVLANNLSTTSTTAVGDNIHLAIGLQYMGTFGNFGVIASYHQLPYGPNALNSAVSLNPLNVGVSYKMDDWKFALDYDSNTTTNSSAAGSSKISSTIVATGRYDMGNWSPNVKIESTSQQGYQATGTDNTNNLMNWSLAAEYKKNAADPFRYEVAYVSGQTTYATANATNATVTGTYAFLGLRYMGDFLK